MHQRIEDRDIIRVTDDTTADEIRESIQHLNATAMAMGRCWYAGKAAVHGRINALLTELEARG